MNFTLLSFVSLGSFGTSPYFSNMKTMAVKNCHFSNNFNPIFFTHFLNSYYIEKTSFSFIQNTAVVAIESEDVNDNKMFSKTLIDKGTAPRFEVRHCLFLKCSSSDVGGGIRIGGDSSEAYFLITSTGFYQCKSSKGDAFYSQTKDMSCTSCCIDRCQKSAFFSKEKDVISLTSLTLSNSVLNTEINCNKIEISRINISTNTNAIKIKANAENIVATNSNFKDNSGVVLIAYETPNAREILLHGCNFIQNKFDYIVTYLGSMCRFAECSIISDRSNKFSKEGNGFVLVNSKLSLSENEAKLRLPIPGTMTGCIFLTQTTVMNDIGATFQCWDKMSITEASSKSGSSSWTGFFVVVAIVVVILVVGFVWFARNSIKASRLGDQIPLFYTR